jgi:hypothetical protein
MLIRLIRLIAGILFIATALFTLPILLVIWVITDINYTEEIMEWIISG